MRALKERILAILEKGPRPESANAEAELILHAVLRKNRPELHTLSDLRLSSARPSDDEARACLTVAEARRAGQPLQHLLGSQFFHAHEYEVDSSTLIPRPETEILIDAALRWASAQGNRPLRFAELGLGSGVLSCELLAHLSCASGVASETNRHAIELSRRNLSRILGHDRSARLQVLQVEASAGFSVFLPQGPFDLILSNPPYLSPEDEIDPEVLKHEPRLALFPESGNPDEFYLDFLKHRQALLAPGGAVFFEIPHERASRLEAEFHAEGARHVSVLLDLTGRPRVLQAEF
jgi:release factor glutamine methyltransferase